MPNLKELVPRWLIRYTYPTIYWEIVNRFVCKPTHVILVSSLKPGGAELEAINYIRAIKTINSKYKIAVVSTDRTNSSWKDKINKYADYIEFGLITSNLDDTIRVKLLTNILLRVKPRVIHLLDSLLGIYIYQNYSKVLSKNSTLYLSVFCNINRGYSSSYITNTLGWIDRINVFITRIFADNLNIINELSRDLSIDKSKFVCHYQPIKLHYSSTKKKFTRTVETKILWAGRIDFQKRPDILIKIAKATKADNCHYFVYGYPTSSGNEWLKRIKKCKNITYCGKYENFHSIDLSKFDMFLYTSNYDGVPNVILEAFASGVPVIAPAVGGIPEVVKNNITGKLVCPNDNITEYVRAILCLQNNKKLKTEFYRESRQLLKKRHTHQSFRKLLIEEKAYIFPLGTSY